jgi:DNA-binding LacI/PurR family transcriptional regulator
VWIQTIDDIGLSNAALHGPRAPRTVAEIARETGLSVTTVRLIANGQAGKYRISEATARIVEEQIRRYGFVVNHAARSLKLRRTDTIGLVAPELTNRVFSARQNEGELASRAFARLKELHSRTMTEPEPITAPFQLIQRGGVRSALRADTGLRRSGG